MILSEDLVSDVPTENDLSGGPVMAEEPCLEQRPIS